ncbi:hypothetical protein B0H10DRAFT_1407418 [Mycena sp. CBHHK59/15]|nr:hypothetical protein B0H10DRAFT_1407418 [Mycena sp. CBHHK59/15]
MVRSSGTTWLTTLPSQIPSNTAVDVRASTFYLTAVAAVLQRAANIDVKTTRNNSHSGRRGSDNDSTARALNCLATLLNRGYDDGKDQAPAVVLGQLTPDALETWIFAGTPFGSPNTSPTISPSSLGAELANSTPDVLVSRNPNPPTSGSEGRTPGGTTQISSSGNKNSWTTGMTSSTSKRTSPHRKILSLGLRSSSMLATFWKPCALRWR